MMTDSHKALMDRWFGGLERRGAQELLALFAPQTWLRNAEGPPMQGADAPQRFLKDLLDEGTARRFTIVDAAAQDDQLFACWEAEYTSNAGNGMRARGITRFSLDDKGRIGQIQIVHTTPTAEAPQPVVRYGT